MTATTNNSAVILQKLETLEASIKRVENKLDSIDCRVQTIERDEVKTESMVATVEDHEDRIRVLERLAPAMRVVVWIAGILGVSIVALIWALITGQASVLFK
jgi:septal ring factor EnvC (AmiA/AmiB activator)